MMVRSVLQKMENLIRRNLEELEKELPKEVITKPNVESVAVYTEQTRRVTLFTTRLAFSESGRKFRREEV